MRIIGGRPGARGWGCIGRLQETESQVRTARPKSLRETPAARLSHGLLVACALNGIRETRDTSLKVYLAGMKTNDFTAKLTSVGDLIRGPTVSDVGRGRCRANAAREHQRRQN